MYRAVRLEQLLLLLLLLVLASTGPTLFGPCGLRELFLRLPIVRSFLETGLLTKDRNSLSRCVGEEPRLRVCLYCLRRSFRLWSSSSGLIDW